jgi:hypothetical protein
VSPRRLPGGLGDSFPSLSLAGVAMAALLLLGACSSNGSDGSTTSTTSSTSTTTTAAPSTTTTSTTTTTTTLPSVDEVTDSWAAYWDAWVQVRASADLDPALLEMAAAADVVDGAISLFERERSSGGDPVESDVVLHATVTDLGPDWASVEDCVLLSPSFTESVGVWYQADLARTEQGWIVDEVRIPSAGGCVPREMADEAIGGYEAYYEAQVSFWDPPDSASPLIDQVLVEPQLSFIAGLLEDHEARGVALRGRPSTHPEVIELVSPTELVILDCFEPALDFGLYEVETGERVPDDPIVREGQRNLRSAVMVFDAGQWKVSDLQGQVDFACDFAPTNRGLPPV